MLGNMGWTEMLVIAVIVLLLFGAKRLPEIGAAMGKGIRDFKRSLSDTEKAITDGTAPPAERLNRGDQPAAATRSDEEVRSEPKRLI